MEFLSDIKMKIMPVVESSYEFDTSRAPESISRNATYAQALLTKMTFIYRVCLTAIYLRLAEHCHVGYRNST